MYIVFAIDFVSDEYYYICMAEPGEGISQSNVIVPRETGIPGSMKWSTFPHEAFVQATELAGRITSKPEYLQAYEIAKSIITAENITFLNRARIVTLTQALQDKNDPDPRRWSDEDIKDVIADRKANNDKQVKEVTDLNEKLRILTDGNPQLSNAYNEVRIGIKQISTTMRVALCTSDEQKGDVLNQVGYDINAMRLIDYDRNVLSGNSPEDK